MKQWYTIVCYYCEWACVLIWDTQNWELCTIYHALYIKRRGFALVQKFSLWQNTSKFGNNYYNHYCYYSYWMIKKTTVRPIYYTERNACVLTRITLCSSSPVSQIYTFQVFWPTNCSSDDPYYIKTHVTVNWLQKWGAITDMLN